MTADEWLARTIASAPPFPQETLIELGALLWSRQLRN